MRDFRSFKTNSIKVDFKKGNFYECAGIIAKAN